MIPKKRSAPPLSADAAENEKTYVKDPDGSSFLSGSFAVAGNVKKVLLFIKSCDNIKFKALKEKRGRMRAWIS